ncbi:hypothetical protein M9H77_30397 [Catharanthus roseus]|uniref:Uncharacterized protein n=1 Tax=Catharanthus roseus TaxID=4058 RepID=A0ACB9ZYZ9_CATRO|nr:hypothetical protein M9H77_30397 [Catharanthus roseus]
MQNVFEQLWSTQDIHRTQLVEIVESTRRYADKLAHQRASIDRQEVTLARLCSRFLPDQSSSREYSTAKFFRCLLEEKTMKRNKNGQKQSGAVGYNGTNLPRKVGQPTIGGWSEDHKQ